MVIKAGVTNLVRGRRKHVAIIFLILTSPHHRPPPSLVRSLVSFPHPPLPLNSSKMTYDLNESSDSVPQSPPVARRTWVTTRLEHRLTRQPFTVESRIRNCSFHNLQAQSGHIGSPQCDGVLPPTRAADRLPVCPGRAGKGYALLPTLSHIVVISE